ncbi:hypothetical protein [Bartonella sp. CB74]|uniref:hypothetical protein n=1 Tax=Bartonella sp. CB74 TaxID=3113620 RepID=UPI002F96B2EB
MIDFVKILKKAINAQSNVTSQVRERIYKRAIETLEHQFTEATIPQAIADEQRQVLQSAITTVEEEYLAVEKELLSSGGKWKSIGTAEGDKNIDFVLPQGNDASAVVAEERQEFFATNLKNNKASDTLSTSGIPDAEPVNMDTYLASQHIDKNTLKDSIIASAAQVDNLHVVSHIFSQALRRANRSSMQKRVMVGIASCISFVILTIGVCFVFGRVFVSSDYQLSEENFRASHTIPHALSVNRKLTQRLLEDGSEIDTSLDKMADSLNKGGGTSTVVSSNLQPIDQLGEAVLYQTRTNYDVEKVATGRVRWSLIKEDRIKGELGESAIQGDITIPDEGLSLRLILRRNTDLSFPAAYIMDFIFTLSDKFSGQAISNIQALTFKASEQSIGQTLTGTVAAKIKDDFFLVALSANHPFLGRNLQIIQELDWIRLILVDKNGRINELTFTKGSIGKAIFNKVIGQWIAQSDNNNFKSE